MSGHVIMPVERYLVGRNEMMAVLVLLNALCITMELPLLQPAHLHTHTPSQHHTCHLTHHLCDMHSDKAPGAGVWGRLVCFI